MKYKNVALKKKDEWLDYLVKNLKNIDYDLGDSKWPKHLIKYISKEKQNFITTKFKGEIFNIKYVVEKNQPLKNLHNMADEVDKLHQDNDEKPMEEMVLSNSNTSD